MLTVLVAYSAWSALATRSDLRGAREGIDLVQRGVTAQDSGAAKRALRDVQARFSDAHDRTDGPLWGLGSLLPVVGDDVSAVRAVSAVGDELSKGAVGDLVAESGTGLAHRLVPRRGRIDIGAVESLAPRVGRAHEELVEAESRLRTVRTDELSRWVRPSYGILAQHVEEANQMLAAADRAVRVLPTMLGKDRPRTYLILFNNNAEIRATGGLPGALSVIRADRGRLSLIRQAAPVDVGTFAAPVLPQTPAEQQIYDTQIAEYIQDTNFTPEFPRTAELVREMWSRTQHQRLDGVLSVDAVSMSYVLRATGPMNAPGGVQLTPENASRELINKVYFRLPDEAAQNAFFRNVAQLMFDEISAGVSSSTQLVSAMGQGTREGRLYVHDFDPAVQRVLSGSTVAGDLHGGDPRVPEVGVYLNDATGSKMSYYLRSRVKVTAESCAGGTQQLAGTADLSYTSDSPPVGKLNAFVTGPGTFGTPKGEQLVLVRIYGPAGGELSNLRVAGDPIPVDAVDDRGRQVTTVVVQLRRAETVRVSWRVRTGSDQDRAARLSVTPGMTSTDAVTRITSACDRE